MDGWHEDWTVGGLNINHHNPTDLGDYDHDDLKPAAKQPKKVSSILAKYEVSYVLFSLLLRSSS